ncbi:hypothetical protein PISL3812_09894 [Talaromyces islandicus]|uniref:Uncharacterized protein n=1 Tax=Talaromyces islandicus TaxID=28573 RepID=A0A0U1MB36_TALIS|nr:hypothetical protein PISL3812_09894 [Talaromyces islandicus]
MDPRPQTPQDDPESVIHDKSTLAFRCLRWLRGHLPILVGGLELQVPPDNPAPETSSQSSAIGPETYWKKPYVSSSPTPGEEDILYSIITRGNQEAHLIGKTESWTRLGAKTEESKVWVKGVLIIKDPDNCTNSATDDLPGCVMIIGEIDDGLSRNQPAPRVYVKSKTLVEALQNAFEGIWTMREEAWIDEYFLFRSLPLLRHLLEKKDDGIDAIASLYTAIDTSRCGKSADLNYYKHLNLLIEYLNDQSHRYHPMRLSSSKLEIQVGLCWLFNRIHETGTAASPPGSYERAESGSHAHPVGNGSALFDSAPSLVAVDGGWSDDLDQCGSDSDTVIMSTQDFNDTVYGNVSAVPVAQDGAPTQLRKPAVYDESTSLQSPSRSSTDGLRLENEDLETGENVHRNVARETCSQAQERSSNFGVAEQAEAAIARTEEKERGQGGVSQVEGAKIDSVPGSHSMTSDAYAPETADKTDNSAPTDLSSDANCVRSKKRKLQHDGVSVRRRSKRLADRRTLHF